MISFKALFQFILEWLSILLQFIALRFVPSFKKDLIILSLHTQVSLMNHQIEAGKLPKPTPTPAFRQFWVLLYLFWPAWQNFMVFYSLQTIKRWHKIAYSFHWFKKSKKPGRPPIKTEVIQTIKRIYRENFNISPEKIREKLVQLGIVDAPCPNTIAKYLPSNKKPPSEKQRLSYLSFLRNHAPHMWGMDFFTVPTLFFKTLYVLVIINHGSRKIEHFAVTTNPTSKWTKQQIREATPFEHQPKYLPHDQDNIFTAEELQEFLAASGITPKITSRKSPWQNPYAERVIGTIRQELLNYIIPLNKKHLHKLLGQYVDYYNHHRPHQRLKGGTPVPSPAYKPTTCKNTKLKATPSTRRAIPHLQQGCLSLTLFFNFPSKATPGRFIPVCTFLEFKLTWCLSSFKLFLFQHLYFSS